MCQICQTPLYTGHKTKKNNTKNTTQCVLDTIIHRTQDEDNQNKIYNTTFVGHHHTQDTRRRQTMQKAQHNMCWTPPYTRHKTKTKLTKVSVEFRVVRTENVIPCVWSFLLFLFCIRNLHPNSNPLFYQNVTTATFNCENKFN